MGLVAIYPKPKMSRLGEPVIKYPYLLRGRLIDKSNQAWSTDVTYIRLTGGFVYLVAIMDWFSRYMLSWELSNSPYVFFCLSALERALCRAKPAIFNSDRSLPRFIGESQFTSDAFTERLQAAEIAISWDGRGRVFNNIFVKRLWRSVKYEEVYLNDYGSVTEAWGGLNRYFNFYNWERFHQSLDYQTPEQMYFDGLANR